MAMGAQIVSGILIGAVVAIAAALVNHRLGVRHEKARWEREDEVQRERWQREDRQREELWEREDGFRDYQERRLAYKTFARFADLTFSGEDRERWEDLQGRTLYDAYRESVNDVRLAAPPEVWEAADRLDRLALSRGNGVSNADYGVRMNAFMRTARDDLGKPPEASYPTEPR